MTASTATTPPSRRGLTLAHLAPPPRTHSFVLGATGSGKSTLVCDLVEEYHRLHPRHTIVLIDPKPELFAERKKEYVQRVFPLGTLAVIRRGREGIVANARLLRDADGYRFKDETLFVIQSVSKALDFLEWRLAHPDVNRPTLAVFLESAQFIGHTRADARVRHVLQQGRQIGLGALIIHQTPTYVDTTFFSESSRLYVGFLTDDEHIKKVIRCSKWPGRRILLEHPVEPRWFWMIEQRERRAYKFTLNKEGGDRD